MISKITLVCLILFAAFQVANSECPVDCVTGDPLTGECISFPDSSEYCSCPSGRADSVEACDTVVDGGCTFATIEDIETTITAPVAAAYFTNDQLHVSIKSPLVLERRYSTIVVDHSLSLTNPACTYPGLYWSRSFIACQDVFEAVMPWSVIVEDCGWELDNSDPDEYIYKADLVLTHHDFTDPFGDRPDGDEVERITDHFIPLQVRFPKNVELTSSATVTAPVQVLAAITRQTINPITHIATIEIATNVLWPYILTNEAISNFPIDYTGDIIVEEDTESSIYNCPNTVGTSCTQVFTITIDATGTCAITGQYQLDFDVDCQLDGEGQIPPECAVDPTATGFIIMDLLSENFCGMVDVDLDIQGGLQSYYGGYLNERDFFLVGQEAYFKAVLTSDNATLTNAQVGEVVLVVNSDELVLWDGTALEAAANFELGTNTANSAEFKFTLAETVQYLSGITEAAPRDITVRARIDVTYSGVPGVKRYYLQSGLHKDVDLQSNIRVENPFSAASGPLFSSTLIAFLVALSLAIMFE